MELPIGTPALLFPTVSLLLLAYTNRFLALASLIRRLHAQYKDEPSPTILAQIKTLRLRLRLIRDMQAIGVLALAGCVVCMFFIFFGENAIAKYLFGACLLLLLVSLGYSVAEIIISTRALTIQISDIADGRRGDGSGVSFGKEVKNES